MYAELYRSILFPFYETFLRRRKTLIYLKELEKNQWLSQRELEEIQWSKLKKLLNHAYENAPYYGKKFEECGLHPDDIKTQEDFRKLSFLTKADIRNNQEDLIARNSSLKIYSHWTGGSTGEPIRFKYDRASYEWRIASAARSDRWAGWDIGVKEFHVWGIRSPDKSAIVELKKRLHHFFLRKKIINVFTFSQKNLPKYIKDFNRFNPLIVFGYSASLYDFAKFIRDNKLSCYKPRAIIATAEQLYPYQRGLLEDIFKTKVFNRYGCREVSLIAMDCDKHEGLHMNIDNLYIEILKDGKPVQSGEIGEVILTDLNNYGMPFIRYKIGDLAVPSDHKCSCGRGLPLIKHVEGRSFDTLVTSDGKFITGLYFTGLMKDYKNITQFQVIQESMKELMIRIVTDKSYLKEELFKIEHEVKKIMGDNMRINFQFVDKILPEKSGKYRIAISKVPVDFGNK